MEKSELVLLDTNIFIEIYKGNEEIVGAIREIGTENIALSSVTLSELVFGARDKKELKVILDSLEPLRIIHVNKDISILHSELMIKYSLSHNLAIPDALIASTAIEIGIPLYTLNKKDFRYIPTLTLL